MAETLLSPPSKRTLIPDNNHNNLPSPKRPKQQPPPPPIPANHASLRIICHASHIGGLIGKSGSSIKSLQLQTGSKIRVDDSLNPGSDHRVILVIAQSIPFKKLNLRKCPSDDVNVEEYAEVVSAVQEAAVRVFEKVLEVSKEGDSGIATCRVLIEDSLAGFVIGKGGKFVEKVKKDSGAKIRVLLADKLPNYVSSPNAIVEIEGDLLAVKKGLLGVCGRLQQFSQGDNSSNKEIKPLESTLQPTLLDFHVDPPLQRAPLYMATTSSSPAIVTRPLLFEVDQHASMESKLNQQEVVFKILCLNDRVGSVIGKGGSVVRSLQEETGAHINIGPPIANCDERLVTITSKEDVDTGHSPAQRAVILVFCRFSDKVLDTGSNKVSSVSARLLVPSNQVGCLLGKGGSIVSEMRKATGANIRILKGEQVPKCATEDDQLVEITGEFVKIQDALYQVTSRLRSDLFPSNTRGASENHTNASLALDASRLERVGGLPIYVNHPSETPQSVDGLYTMRQGLDSLYNHQRLDHSHLAGSRSRTSEVAFDASYHGRERDLPIGINYSSVASQSIGGLSTVRQGLNSLYNHQRLDHSRLAGSQTFEVPSDASFQGRDRDLPIGVHHSFASSQSMDGLSTMRQGLDSLYNRQKMDHSSFAGSRTSEVALDASRHGRVRDLPIGGHHSFVTSQSIDGLSTMRQGVDSLYNSQSFDHSPLAGSRTSEVAIDASRHGRNLPIGAHHSSVTSLSIDGLTTMRQGLGSFYDTQKFDHPPLAGHQTSEVANGGNSRSFVLRGRGLAPANGGAERGSANRPAIVTNTTVEILVPEDAISCVYGENGRNLMRIRQISGAKVEVHEALPGTRDRPVLISGTPDETQAAQSLLHAFILTGSS